jgi:DNA-binding MarR family transcriptional regulator
MSKMSILEKQNYILAKLFLLPKKFQSLEDRVFAGELTLRQWFLTMTVAQCGDTPCTLNKVAELMGSSHQNVKQLALKLQKGAFLSFRKDKYDLRATHLVLTDNCCIFLRGKEKAINLYIAELFKDLSDDEIDLLYSFINKLYESVLKMERELSKMKGCFR